MYKIYIFQNFERNAIHLVANRLGMSILLNTDKNRIYHIYYICKIFKARCTSQHYIDLKRDLNTCLFIFFPKYEDRHIFRSGLKSCQNNISVIRSEIDHKVTSASAGSDINRKPRSFMIKSVILF